MAKAALGQRILGAAVLLSLGFIGYSVFLQSNTEAYIDRSAQIPVQTNYIEPLDFEKPRGVDTEVVSNLPNEMFNPTQEADVSELESALPVDESGNPNSWLIQVGSFSSSERALEIRDELISQGFKAYVRMLNDANSGGELHRVLVGPYLGANEIAQDQSKIDELLSLETILLDYAP